MGRNVYNLLMILGGGCDIIEMRGGGGEIWFLYVRQEQ